MTLFHKGFGWRKEVPSGVVNLGPTTKLCKSNFDTKPHPRHVVVVARPKIG